MKYGVGNLSVKIVTWFEEKQGNRFLRVVLIA